MAFRASTNGSGESMRLDSAGRLGIRTASPKLDLQAASSGGLQALNSNEIALRYNMYNSGGDKYIQGSNKASSFVMNNAGQFIFYSTEIASTSADSAVTGFAQRLRIDSNGYFYYGNQLNSNPAASGATGLTLRPDPLFSIAAAGNSCMNVGRNTNDGALVNFYQAGTAEGSISVSGSTVSYNGAHLARWSQLPGGVERAEILRGSVLSNLDEMCEWAYDAQGAVLYTEEDELPEGVSVGDVKIPAVVAGTENNEQLNRMQVSDVEGDKNVSGVFQAWDDDDDTYTNDFYCAMTGDFVIRIAQGTTVARGDLLMSAGDGTAKPQDDDIIRSKTIAKVTSTNVCETYADGSYCVPCVLMAC
jgi:hypothetical protein